MIYFYCLADDSADSMTMMDDVIVCMAVGMDASVVMSLMCGCVCAV